MAGVTISLNSAEFRKAVAEYAAVSKKDSAYAMNRSLNNYMVQGQRLVKDARKSEIQKIADTPWWPKLVASVIRGKAGGAAASKAFQAQWAATKKKQRDMELGKKQKAFKLDKEERSYNRLAKATSKALIGARLRAVRFMAFFFVASSQKIVGFVPGTRPVGGKSFAGFNVSVRPATPSRLSAFSSASYAYKRRSNAAAGLEQHLKKVVDAAAPATVADMKIYIARQLEKRARQYSGRK
jgi:hypothetical protein